jgi:putative membrane protein insertion efficiency factor
MIRSVLIGAIRVYQVVLSPLLPPACRFYPSCSHYAAQAIARRGALMGLGLAAGRLLRCHPWHAGGYDPVPERGWRTRHPAHPTP